MADVIEEDNESILDTLRQLIEGCENYVQDKVAEVRQTCKRELSEYSEKMKKDQELDMEKRGKEIEHLNKKLKVLESENSRLIRKVDSVERDFVSKEERINAVENKLKESEKEKGTECWRCTEFVSGVVMLGNSILQGGTAKREDAVHVKSTSDLKVDPVFSLDAQRIPEDRGQSGNPTCAMIMDTDAPPGILYAQPVSPVKVNVRHEELEPTPDTIAAGSSASCEKSSKVPPMFSHQKAHTAAVYESFEELSEEMKSLLGGHFSPRSTQAVKESLSDLQRAYFDYLYAKHQKVRPTELAKIMFSKGVEDRIWPLSFKPSPGLSFHDYLVQRIKNRRMRFNRMKMKELVKTQKERLM